MLDWISVTEKEPPHGLIVETKIRDERGCRNEQKLMRIGRLYYLPDGSMYVYYTPTHWRFAV